MLEIFLNCLLIIKSLHVPRIPGLDGLSGFPNMGNLPYMEQVTFHEKCIWKLFRSQNHVCKQNQTFGIKNLRLVVFCNTKLGPFFLWFASAWKERGFRYMKMNFLFLKQYWFCKVTIVLHPIKGLDDRNSPFWSKKTTH